MKSTIFTIFFTFLTIYLFSANIMVTNTNDAGANSLRAAIITANGNGADDIITITATGTITLSSDFPIISTNMTITGSGAASLIIDGVDIYKIFEISGSSTIVVLEEMTITKGKGKLTTIDTYPANSLYGGAIFLINANLTVNNCIMNNHTQCEGGGAFVNLDGSTKFNSCTFTGNIAQETGINDGTGVAGVGIVFANTGQTVQAEMNNCTMNNNIGDHSTSVIEVASEDEDVNDAILTLNSCVMNNNMSDNGGAIQTFAGTVFMNNCHLESNSANFGGALVLNFLFTNTIGSKAVITNTTFTGNTASSGGAITVKRNSNLNLQNCQIINNSATLTNGGAINNERGNIIIDQCTFSGNQTTGTSVDSYGGAIRNLEAILTITNSTFSGNQSNLDGGAIEMESGTANLTNCTFSANSAQRFGGTMDVFGGSMNLNNCTLVNNVADSDNTDSFDPGGYGAGEGGGISEFGPGVVTITNCIIANNILGSGAADDLYSDNAISSGGHNLVEDAGGLTVGTDDITGQDPNLAALADNGGAVQTFAPNGGSPAINHVDNALGPCTDARLAARTGNSDIGAYETAGTFSDVSIVVVPTSVAENSGIDLVYTYTRTGSTCGNILVNFSVSGTAVFSTDYSASNHSSFSSSTGSVVIPDGSSSVALNVTPINNSATDGNRTVFLTVTSGGGYNVASSNFSITGTITDDETPTLPSINVAILTAASATAEDSGTPLKYQFTRTGSTVAALTINFTLSGTASTSDYSIPLNGQGNASNTSGLVAFDMPNNRYMITFPIGDSTVDLEIVPSADAIIEADEAVVVTVAAP